MTEIENQQLNPNASDGIVVAEGGDAGTQSVASANTDETDFTGSTPVEPVEVVQVASSDEVNAFVERLVQLYAISYNWRQVEQLCLPGGRLADEVPTGYSVEALITMAVDAYNTPASPDFDTRGTEEGAHGDDSVEAEIAKAEADEAKASARALGNLGDAPTQSALSQDLGISDEKLDEVLPCGHTRRDHHGDLTGGLPSFLKKLLGGEAPVKVTPIGEGFNLFEAITGLDQQRTAAVPTYGHNDQPEVSEAHQRLHDDIPMIEAQLEITLPSGEVFLTHIQADAGHAWGHTRHGDKQCLNATADLVGQLLNELRVRLDRELLLSNMYHDSRADNVCDK